MLYLLQDFRPRLSNRANEASVTDLWTFQIHSFVESPDRKARPEAYIWQEIIERLPNHLQILPPLQLSHIFAFAFGEPGEPTSFALDVLSSLATSDLLEYIAVTEIS